MKRSIKLAAILIVLILLNACSQANPAHKAGETAVPATQSTGEVALTAKDAETEESAFLPSTASKAVSTTEPEERQEGSAAEETEAPVSWEWTYDTPENQGMDSEALAALHTTYDSFPLLSAVIVRNGVIVDTYYKDGYDESSVFTLQSTSKSITSALVGIAIEQGYIESVDVPLSDYFPELQSTPDERWSRITIRHLLAHTSGIASTDISIWYDWRASEDWLAYLFALPIYTEPGTTFDYSTGNTHLLSAVLERAVGKPLDEYAREVLFEPLGMTSAGLGLAPEGVGDGGNGFYMTTLDLARFGLLYLSDGVWQDQQIVPAEWVEVSTSTQAQRSSDGARYGYQWWLRAFDGHQAFIAQGHFGQYIIVVPELSLLIAINSYYEGSRSIYWQIAEDVIDACERT